MHRVIFQDSDSAIMLPMSPLFSAKSKLRGVNADHALVPSFRRVAILSCVLLSLDLVSSERCCMATAAVGNSEQSECSDTSNHCDNLATHNDGACSTLEGGSWCSGRRGRRGGGGGG